MKASLSVELLCLEVEWRALLDRNKALELQSRACLLASLSPLSDSAGIPLLGQRALLLAHNLAPLVLAEISLLQAARGLLLVPTQTTDLANLPLAILLTVF